MGLPRKLLNVNRTLYMYLCVCECNKITFINQIGDLVLAKILKYLNFFYMVPNF